MRLEDILLRDPYVLFVNNTYYLYGSRNGNEEKEFYQNNLEVYKSKDLLEWSEGKSLLDINEFDDKNVELWAPEVYHYSGAFYMFVTMKVFEKGKETHRGTYVFASDTPDGEFRIHSPKAITPENWECLDGSLYFENEEPYMIFCREWTQCGDGEICAVKMDNDLKKSVGEAKILFSASEAPWVCEYGDKKYVTDGPFLFKDKTDGTLYMIWSSFTANGYAVGMSYSPSHSIMGEWKHCDLPLFDKNGGHAMIFETMGKECKIILHAPNDAPASPKILNFTRVKAGDYAVK